MTRAERLVAAIYEMPIEDIRDRIAWARMASNDELAERWERERKKWAEDAARRLRER